MKTGGGDFVAGGDVVGGLQEDGDGAELLGAGLGGVTLGGFLLEHQHEVRGERAGEHGVHPRGGDGVGEVGDDLEAGGGFVGGEGGKRVIDGVAFEEVEGV